MQDPTKQLTNQPQPTQLTAGRDEGAEASWRRRQQSDWPYAPQSTTPSNQTTVTPMARIRGERLLVGRCAIALALAPLAQQVCQGGEPAAEVTGSALMYPKQKHLLRLRCQTTAHPFKQARQGPSLRATPQRPNLRQLAT